MEIKFEKCVPCRGGIPPLDHKSIEKLIVNIPSWNVHREQYTFLAKKFKTKNFKQSMNFANLVFEISEEEGHHPKIVVEFGNIEVLWWTHKINGLHKNDFIMAAKTDDLFNQLQN
tara:strand:- start:397 stop:741 length:345 start_codon:yes stop_codon:yes gene_type:complete